MGGGGEEEEEDKGEEKGEGGDKHKRQMLHYRGRDGDQRGENKKETKIRSSVEKIFSLVDRNLEIHEAYKFWENPLFLSFHGSRAKKPFYRDACC